VFGKHTLPEIDLEGVSRMNSVFLGHTNIMLKESVYMKCAFVCVCVSQGGVIPLESHLGVCGAGEYPV